MTSLQVIYENGVLRPLHPLDLAEGTKLEVVMVVMIELAPSSTPSTQTTVDEAAYAEFLSQLDGIAALPLQSTPQPYTARDHDAILYPKQGTMP